MAYLHIKNEACSFRVTVGGCSFGTSVKTLEEAQKLAYKAQQGHDYEDGDILITKSQVVDRSIPGVISRCDVCQENAFHAWRSSDVKGGEAGNCQPCSRRMEQMMAGTCSHCLTDKATVSICKVDGSGTPQEICDACYQAYVKDDVTLKVAADLV